MARSLYIMCDDCNKEYCVNLVEKNKSLKQTSYLAEAEFVLKHGDLSDFQKRQLELARQSGKTILTQADLSGIHPKRGLRAREISYDLEL